MPKQRHAYKGAHFVEYVAIMFREQSDFDFQCIKLML